jgi:hypothetical protein
MMGAVEEPAGQCRWALVFSGLDVDQQAVAVTASRAPVLPAEDVVPGSAARPPGTVWEVTCAGAVVRDVPARTFSLSIERGRFFISVAAPQWVWWSLAAAVAGTHPVALRVVQWLEAVLRQ